MQMQNLIVINSCLPCTPFSNKFCSLKTFQEAQESGQPVGRNTIKKIIRAVPENTIYNIHVYKK